MLALPPLQTQPLDVYLLYTYVSYKWKRKDTWYPTPNEMLVIDLALTTLFWPLQQPTYIQTKKYVFKQMMQKKAQENTTTLLISKLRVFTSISQPYLQPKNGKARRGQSREHAGENGGLVESINLS